MSNEIEVYNAYFGDCIMLKDRTDDSNLLVDFGIHYYSNVSSTYGTRKALTGTIADDIATRYSARNTSLLITHFHEDHVSGLIYMYKSKQKKFSNLFKTVYIANIWNDPFAVASNILEELLLENQLKSSGLPRTTASLFDILDFLCANVSDIRLLSKGISFENEKYITLWPKINDSENHITEIVHELKLPPDFEGKLIALSEIVCIYVTNELLGMDSDNRYSDDEVYEYHNDNFDGSQRTVYMRTVYEKLLDEVFNYVVDSVQDNQIAVQMEKLNELNHKYNVVFQNKMSGSENVLFTGDIEKEQMQEIAMASDIKLHPSYKYIKIPHHGTLTHYFDYSKYSPEKIIITNGMVNAKNSVAYRICKGYGSINSIHLCANSNNCCNCSGACITSKSICSVSRKIVYSNLYETI